MGTFNADINNEGEGYSLGQVVQVVCQFLERDPITDVLTPVDPTTVACVFTEGATVTTLTYGTSPLAVCFRQLDADSEPWYVFRFTPAARGKFTYRILSTGTGASAATVECFVKN